MSRQTTACNVKVQHIRPKYKNLKEWMDDPDNVYIGRRGIVFIDGKRFPEQDSVFANPFKIRSSEALSEQASREKVIDDYRTYIKQKIENGSVDLESLRGKALGCWCRPNRCHADVLLELLDYQVVLPHTGARHCKGSGIGGASKTSSNRSSPQDPTVPSVRQHHHRGPFT